jgi:hypothetical protein
MSPDNALKDLVKGVADLCNLISDISVGLSFKEVTDLVTVGTDIPALVQDAPALYGQYKGLDDAARTDLFGDIAQTVKFPANASVQTIVEKALEAGVALSALFQELGK